MNESFVVGLVSVAVLGGAAQWLGWRLRLPAILILLIFGFAAGPEGLALVRTDAMFGELLLPFVAISVAILLFEGALTLHAPELEERFGVVLRLVTLGTAVTWLLSALGARYVLDFSWSLSILVGAVLVVTGPTVVIPLLRQIRPRGPGGTVLKWEGILIDPIGAVLAVLVFEALVDGGFMPAVTGIAKTVAAGSVFGLLPAWILTICLARYWIPDHLHSASALGLALLGYVLANMLQHESGLLAVTVMGVALANQKRVDLSHIMEFKENLQVLLISALFILLAARVRLEELAALAVPEFAYLALLIFVVRPLSVALSTAGSGMPMRDRLFVSAMAPRGVVAAAVIAIFALRLQEEGFAGAERLVPVVFFVIAGTVAFYGLLGRPLAHRLGVAEESPNGVLIIGAHPFARGLGKAIQELGLSVLLVDTNARHIASARLDGLPVYHGSILSDQADEELDLPGIGKLFAMTANDEVNALSAGHFVHLFGRENLFQLPTARKPREGSAELGSELRARVLFEGALNYDEIQDRFRKGAEFKATLLTDEFDMEDWREGYGKDALPVLTVGPNGSVTVSTRDQPLEPKPGDTLLGFVGPLTVSLPHAE
ncbi:MAG: cation:proton antiporter [Longimicrobiales bacterium]|nr:cation:proton antiporter [Longimicrobiales bacterium]